uniref:Uncharacterized protein n=1 Tax=Physcomitrium patens TaxID=3218 RepID=A0A2K1JV09_PHYPA|nr:hypothetical protein PHYPA_015132 [Physcomitrium patens]
MEQGTSWVGTSVSVCVRVGWSAKPAFFRRQRRRRSPWIVRFSAFALRAAGRAASLPPPNSSRPLFDSFASVGP